MLSNNQHWILITTAAVEADTLLEAAEEVEDTPAPDSLVLEDNHRNLYTTHTIHLNLKEKNTHSTNITN